jgi:chorismate synthase
MLRFLTAGESHGPGLVAVVEGLPAGLPVEVKGIAHELARRRLGFGRGARMRIELDELEILAGVRHGFTLGSPVAVIIRNTEWPRWQQEMSPHPPDSNDTDQGPSAPTRALTKPRPGHADLAGMLKYDTKDARDVLERASARETAARTVVGYLAKQLLETIGVSIVSHVVAIGDVHTTDARPPGPSDLEAIDASPVRCLDPDVSASMVAAIEAAKASRDTLGGVVEVLAYGLPPGIGSHVHWDRRLDGLIAGALMSIHAIKGVEVGDGFTSSARPGSIAHDEIFYSETFYRDTNRAGGTEGGMTTGGPLRVRAAMKPISTVLKGLRTVDVESKEPVAAFYERSDTCAVPAAGVVAEQMVAIVLAREIQRQFGGDTVEDLVGAVDRYRERLGRY